MPPRRSAPRPAPTFRSWTGEVFRATSWDTPLWVSPNRRDGRWNLARHDVTQYFSLDPETPYAELLRGEDLRTEEEAQTFQTTLWQLRVDEGAVVDYSTPELAESAGFPARALLGDDHERCQAEAARLRSLGARGLLAPSAALVGGVNLTVFGPRVAVGWTVVPPLASMVPAQSLVTGHPPPGLVKRVRYYGAAHQTLVDHERAQKRLFP